MRRLFMSLIATSFVGSAQASVIAIIDSGLDIKHEAIRDHVWTNTNDDTVDRRDNDRNGYVDDLHGWNFFAHNSVLLEPGYEGLLDQNIQKYFHLQGKGMKGLLTKEDKQWMSEAVSNPNFVDKLQLFGNYAHGTHVSGISLQQNTEAEILTVRLIPTKNPLASMKSEVQQALFEGKDINFIVKFIIRGGLSLFAKVQALPFQQVGQYIGGHPVDIVNASLGTSTTQIETLLTPILEMLANGPVKQELLDELTTHFLNRLIVEQASFTQAAPNSLFVFAAGNDGKNNDIFPTAPANIKASNTISVGASLGSMPASFTNFGMNVDLLAPGVSSKGPVPGDQYIELSGTSQAAPVIAGLASKLKDINPELDPAQLKAIILGTVDKKEHLKNVVASSGIVNNSRAIAAAENSLDVSLDKAILNSREQVADVSRVDVNSFFQEPLPKAFMLGLH